MKYEIVESPTPIRLVALVQGRLDDGWKLCGNVFTVSGSLCQVMTKGDYVRPARLKEKKK